MNAETATELDQFAKEAENSQPPKFVTASLRWVTAAGEEREVDGTVQDVSPSGIVCHLAEPLETGQTLWMRWLLVEHRTTVQHCQRQGKEYLVVLRQVSQERRTEDRLTAGGSGKLFFADDPSGRSVTVQVVNVSGTGAQITCPESLGPEQSVRLTGSTWECSGLVRYCRREGDSFLTGIQFVRPPRTRRW